MKKLMKKLAAIALAGTMILSCAVMTASATENVKNDYTSGSSEGKGSNESNKLENPVRVVLPTESNTVFNMKLDPHQLIKSTEGARYANQTFDYENTKLFFLTSANTWTGSSQSLTVVNKGDVNISLGIDLEVDKGASAFDFVDDKEDLEDAESPAMYLALVSGENVKPVQAAGPKVMGAVSSDKDTITAAFNYANGLDDDSKAAFETAVGNGITLSVTVTDENASLPDLTISGYTATLSAATLEEEDAGTYTIKTDDDDEDVIGSLVITLAALPDEETSVSVSLKKVAGEPEEPTLDGIVTIAKEGDQELVSEATFAWDSTNADDDAKAALQTAIGAGVTVKVDWDDSESITATAPTIEGYTVTGNPTSIDMDTEEVVYTIANSDGDAIATLTVALPGGSIDDSDAGVRASATVTLKIGKSGGGNGEASIKTSILKTEGAYKDQWNATSNKYERTPVTTVTDFQQVAFYLTGDINTSDDWDDNGSDVEIKVTWNIVEYDADNYNEEAGSSGGAAVEEDAEPTVERTKDPEGTSAPGRNAEYTVTPGTGSYKDYVPVKATYIRSGVTDGTTTDIAFVSNEDNVVTIGCTSAIQNGSEWKMVFQNGDDASDTITVDINCKQP